jgi:hypothetical protein
VSTLKRTSKTYLLTVCDRRQPASHPYNEIDDDKPRKLGPLTPFTATSNEARSPTSRQVVKERLGSVNRRDIDAGPYMVQVLPPLYDSNWGAPSSNIRRPGTDDVEAQLGPADRRT